MQVKYYKVVDLPCNYGRMWMGEVNNNHKFQMIAISWRFQERIKSFLNIKPHGYFKNEDNLHFPVYYNWNPDGAYNRILDNLSLLIYEVNITVAACQEVN